MKKIILWDLDGTLLDFKQAERQAIINCFQQFNLGKCTDQMLHKYSLINNEYWLKMERKEIKKEVLLVKRFEDFFAQENIDVALAKSFNQAYQNELAHMTEFCPHGLEMVKYFSPNYKQHIISNGSLKVQETKLHQSGLDKYMDKVFLSEQLGVDKPSVEFFDQVLSNINYSSLAEIIIVGDSLTSDILGGNNAKIDTCWYNPDQQVNNVGVKPTYEISDLLQLKQIIK